MKYTSKQIEHFIEMCRNGILKQLEEPERLDIIESIISIDEATILAGCSISVDELVEIADSRCELGDLAETATVTYNIRYPKPVEKQKQVNYKSELIALFGLRNWATKEDIVNELNLAF